MTSPDAALAREHVLAVPVGSLEQHGAHLPLGTDTDVAVELVRRLAQQRRDVVAGPAVAYGASGEHQSFAGTVSIGTEALAMVLVELGRSASATFARLVFVNGHGGNADALALAVSRLTAESRDVLAWSPSRYRDAHAGRSETSLQLALAPDGVRLESAEAGDTRSLAELLPLLQASSVAAVSPNGVLGDPAGASAAEGRELLDALAADLLAAVQEWAPR